MSLSNKEGASSNANTVNSSLTASTVRENPLVKLNNTINSTCKTSNYQTTFTATNVSNLVGYSNSKSHNESTKASLGLSSYISYSETVSDRFTRSHLNNEVSLPVGSATSFTNTSFDAASVSGMSNSPYNTSQNATYLSEIEQSILRSQVPINISETEEITVLGQRGIWANKEEVVKWQGTVPLSEYLINEDQMPEIITKKTHQNLTYIQELAVRYLKPPTPPTPGDIIITKEADKITPPAPPVVIRQQPARPVTPKPLLIREAPPPPPPQVGRKVVTISGKRLPPPPRKVVIERLPPLPSKPQSIIIERWLPYSPVKRRVIYQRSNNKDPIVIKPRNVIVQWEAPQVQIKKTFKYLGIIRANPVDYVQRYGPTLKTTRELPDFVLDIPPPPGITLAADYEYNQVHELEGDIEAMQFVDLEKEGLNEYRSQLERLGIRYLGNSSKLHTDSYSYQQSQPKISSIISEIFSQVDKEQTDCLTIEDAEKLYLKLNSRLGRQLNSEKDMQKFFNLLKKDINDQTKYIRLADFRRAFENFI